MQNPKTKIGIDVHSSGYENNNLLAIVANVNGAGYQISREQVATYLLVVNAIVGTATREFIFEGDSVLHVLENSKPTVTLTWKEVYELEGDNDIPQDLFQAPQKN